MREKKAVCYSVNRSRTNFSGLAALYLECLLIIDTSQPIYFCSKIVKAYLVTTETTLREMRTGHKMKTKEADLVQKINNKLWFLMAKKSNSSSLTQDSVLEDDLIL